MKETMTEPRKVVLILGNGFDLDLGLKTSYKDFWESNNCPRNYPAPLIYHLNQYKKGDVSIYVSESRTLNWVAMLRNHQSITNNL